MKLTAKTTPYSSILGGGLRLHNEQGHATFMVMFRGTTTKGITKEEDVALSAQFAAWIEKHGLEVPDREPGK